LHHARGLLLSKVIISIKNILKVFKDKIILKRMEEKYSCPRCGFESNFKRAIIAHLKRKNKCNPTVSSISIEDALAKLKRVVNYKERCFQCYYCDTKFNSSSNRSRHHKSCSQRPDNSLNEIIDDPDSTQALREEIRKMKKEMEELKSKALTVNNKTINNNARTIKNIQNIQNNNNNNITCNFGKECLEFLSDNFIRDCLLKLSKGVVDLTKEIHFNPEKPEYHNLTTTNLRAPYLDIYKDGKWCREDKNEVLNNLIKRYIGILSSHYDEYEEEIREKLTKTNLGREKFKMIDKFIDDVVDGEPDSMKNLRKAIFFLIINNRTMIAS
jgi:hypothetical protein